MTRKAKENYSDFAEGVRLAAVGLFGLAWNLVESAKDAFGEARARRRDELRKDPAPDKAEDGGKDAEEEGRKG